MIILKANYEVGHSHCCTPQSRRLPLCDDAHVQHAAQI